jgi:hypothetical protein
VKKLFLALFLLFFTVNIFAVETIVFVRHGEKPEKGLGQLSCQGLNRSLKLPNILEAKFGKPDAIFASNPSFEKQDYGVYYSYIRPLATIEPTAIKFAMPVNVKYAFNDKNGIVQALSNPALKNSTVFVAWEHYLIVDIAQELLKEDKKIVLPHWQNSDFDSIYVLKIDWENQKYSFTIDKQGLNSLSSECPDF